MGVLDMRTLYVKDAIYAPTIEGINAGILLVPPRSVYAPTRGNIHLVAGTGDDHELESYSPERI